jgi:nitrite reductase (NO-forming)
VVPGQLRPTDVIGAFFLAGVAFALAGAGVAVANGIDPWPWGRWLALHLLFIGGISQLVLGASQFFAGAFLATDPPPRGLIRAQLACWNAGTVAIAAGVPENLEWLTIAGAALLLADLALYAAGFVTMSRRALNTAPWAARWYLMAAAFLAPGIVAGVAMANGWLWTHGNLLGAHMALNLAGWFGAAIVGTLHTFYPSLTRTQLRFPRLQGPTCVAWGAGVTGLALGYGFALAGLATAGWIVLGLAAALLLANVIGAVVVAVTPLSLPARIVGVGQLFLLAGVVVAAVAAIDLGPEHALVGSTRAAVATLLVAGWIGLTVAGSLLHLLALLNRVRDLRRGMPEPHGLRDGAIAAAAALAVGALAIAHLLDAGDLADVAAVLVAGVYAGLGARVVLLAARAAIRARPRI